MSCYSCIRHYYYMMHKAKTDGNRDGHKKKHVFSSPPYLFFIYGHPVTSPDMREAEFKKKENIPSSLSSFFYSLQIKKCSASLSHPNMEGILL